MCTSSNRCTDDYFDITVFHSDDITRELSRILNQIPVRPKRGHYAFDPLKTRMKDFTCLYFPTGFDTPYGDRRIRCHSLGQFVAIEFRAFIARLLLEAEEGEDTAYQRRQIDSRIEFTKEHKANLTREAQQWRKMKDFWIQGFSTRQIDVDPWGRLGRVPLSAAEASEKLMNRMGYEELNGRLCLNGQICEAGHDQGAKMQNLEHQRPLLLAKHDLGPVDDYEGPPKRHLVSVDHVVIRRAGSRNGQGNNANN